VLTQYKSGSLERHVRIGWGPIFHHELDEWIQCVPPQLRVGQRWYQGTADAVYQNVYLLDQDRPRLVLVLSGDHVYKMDYAKMIEAHETSGAMATVAAIEVPVGEASAFGVIAVDAFGQPADYDELRTAFAASVPPRIEIEAATPVAVLRGVLASLPKDTTIELAFDGKALAARMA
jgi:glucose-1-phosphate adenylyltransferase